MKTVLLAGGFGSRISEESAFKPKPMVEIGGKPLLWHIMKEFAYYGHTEFIICAGYKQEYIKEWFSNYFIHNSDVTFDFRNNKNEVSIHHSHLEPWKVTRFRFLHPQNALLPIVRTHLPIVMFVIFRKVRVFVL